MNLKEFQELFPERTKIGTDLTEAHYVKYYDNGEQVGMWRYDRQTTEGSGEILAERNAAMARAHFSRMGCTVRR